MPDNSPLPQSPSAQSTLDALRIHRGTAKRRRRFPWGWLVFGLLAAGGTGYWAMHARNAPQVVEIATVGMVFPSQAATSLNATGRVVAQRRAAVASKATGRLEALFVQEGQAVKAGQIIARIESRDVAAQRDQAAAGVRQAQANLEQGLAEQVNAELDLKRQQELAKQSFVSAAAVDAAVARLTRAQATVSAFRAAIGVSQASLRSTEVGVDQTLIRAPFDGVILTKSANVGDTITPFSAAAGTQGAVVTMADMATLEVEADVSESSIAKITEGQDAEIQLDAYPELRLPGRVSRVVPTVDRSKATILVKVAFLERDKRVLPDMSAKIAFLTRPIAASERKAVIAIRPESITERDGRSMVFVVKADETLELRAIERDDRIGELVRVSGVNPGERIVIAPSDKLAPAMRVTSATK